MNCELLTNEQMALADKLAVRAGIASLTLMENAGTAVADEAAAMVAPGATIAILCGPGNNGGDGFVAARLLQERGFHVALALSCERSKLTGDAALMAKRWDGEAARFDPSIVNNTDLIIDAVFGAGLTRPITRDWQGAQTLDAAKNSRAPILSVDIPSGVNGTTGQIMGLALKANRTVTFFRKKPGHLLYPGKALCGETRLVDIGIPASVLGGLEGTPFGPANCFSNTPDLWSSALPDPGVETHKYMRGHLVAVSGPAGATGAARLAARGALRVGAGLVTVASPSGAMADNAAHLTAIMLAPFDSPQDLKELLQDRRKNTIVIGPGCGVGQVTRELVGVALSCPVSTVIDADALTSFEDRIDNLVTAIAQNKDRNVVMTPHEGEFNRLFSPDPGTPPQSKLERARDAAGRSGAVVVLKGPDTVVATPDGRTSINENAPPWLATAGSGDVLSGLIGGLLAQNMSAFEAASAAVWLHGACASKIGRGLIAEDLPEALPAVLQTLTRPADGPG